MEYTHIIFQGESKSTLGKQAPSNVVVEPRARVPVWNVYVKRTVIY